MSSDSRSPADPQFSNLDEAGTIALCKSLADYGEAGSLSTGLMGRVGRYAVGRYPSSLDVLLAVGRMYLLAGDPAQAKATLLLAGSIVPDEPQTLRLLAEAQRRLGQNEAPADLLKRAAGGRLAPGESAHEPTPGVRPARGNRPQNYGRAAAPPPHDAMLGAPKPRASSPRRPDRAQIGRIAPVPSRQRAGIHGISVSNPPPQSLATPSIRARLLDPDDPHRWLEPYELIAEIAAGGMATVFLGRLVGAGGFQRFVAIKRLHPHLARETQFIDMFLDEARLAAGIHHPHVVPILEVGESDAGYYLVMEFVEGDTLTGITARALARGAPLPRPVAVRLMLDALAGLHAAHQLNDSEGKLVGLVHRDCTAHNILVGVDGSARITDFGVARAASRLTATRPQIVKGKVAYLSPEQAMASNDLDCRSDVFTMGIVLWETLAGRPLFLADSEPATVTRLLHAPIPSVRRYVPEVPHALDEVCATALERDRSVRFQSAAAMAEALEDAARASPGGIASQGEVTRCIESLIGEDIAAQRDAVRAWMTKTEGARHVRPTSRSGSGSGSMPSVHAPRANAGAPVAFTLGSQASASPAQPSATRRPMGPPPLPAAEAKAVAPETTAPPVGVPHPPIDAVSPVAKTEGDPGMTADAKADPKRDSGPGGATESADNRSSDPGVARESRPSLSRIDVARVSQPPTSKRPVGSPGVEPTVPARSRKKLFAVALIVLLGGTSPMWVRIARVEIDHFRQRAKVQAAAPAPSSDARKVQVPDGKGGGKPEAEPGQE